MKKLILTSLILSLAAVLTAGPTDYEWQKPQAKVLPNGDLEWAPRPFEFQAGKTVRYIDFEEGDDSNPGTKAAPWKHHPWDRAAKSNAAKSSGPVTYVFKRGVIYRGALEAKGSGTADEPIRLTSDPHWGSGEAVICGSVRVTDWTKGADHEDIPEASKVWRAKVEALPRAVWVMGSDGAITRLKLARTPNWTESNEDDVLSEWWTWKVGWSGSTTRVGGRKMHLGKDPEHLTKDPEYYQDALVWSEWGVMMGAPYAAPVEAVKPDKDGAVALAFQGPWHNDSQRVFQNNRYYLEDKPQYLDEPGEYWFDRQGKRGQGGTLYLRLPGDADPRKAVVEAGDRINLIDGKNVSHVHISGLTFRFGNIFWRLDYRFFQHEDVDSAAVRFLGTGENLHVRNCRFLHTSQAVRMDSSGAGEVMDDIVVADNEILHTDHGAIKVRGSGKTGGGRMLHCEVLRNKLYRIGQRALRPNGHHAVTVGFPQTSMIAGNILHRCYASGLFTFGGKGSGQAGLDVPLARMLIFNNKVTDGLLASNDWGNIETWQGGPTYVFNNVSVNPGGLMNWTGKRFAHAYDLDAAFKNYHFNNIAVGKYNDPSKRKLANTSAFQEIHSYQNTFFNNTAFRFLKGSRRQAPDAGRDKFLGNIFQDISEMVFRHSDKEGVDLNAHHAGEQGEAFAYETNAYARNVLYDIGGMVAVFEAEGGDYPDVETFAEGLRKRNALASDAGVLSETPPLRNPEDFDFRPNPNSAAIDRGVKAFVPWSLHAMVGEWNFTRNNADPRVVIDEHWYLTPYHKSRADYYTRPMFPLLAMNVDADDYVSGELEDWTDGALRLDGSSQYAMLDHDVVTRPFSFEGEVAKHEGWLTAKVPVQVAAGQEFTVELTLNDPPQNMKIAAHLHWNKASGFGGFNAWGGLPKDVQGGGPYTFTFKPEDKEDLEKFVLTVFLSPTGEFADRKEATRVPIDKAPSSRKLVMKTVNVGAATKKDAEPTAGVHGEALKSPQVHRSSFLLEAYLKTADRDGGVIVSKHDGQAGYRLDVTDAGAARLTFGGGGASVEVAGKAKIADGRWHHVLAEVDRQAGVATIYVDGQTDATKRFDLDVSATLANEADVLVGGGPKARKLACTMDFLRIALGTLADAKTDIGELYAWQFDGPFLRDFTGREPNGKRRDAGAIESDQAGVTSRTE